MNSEHFCSSLCGILSNGMRLTNSFAFKGIPLRMLFKSALTVSFCSIAILRSSIEPT